MQVETEMLNNDKLRKLTFDMGENQSVVFTSEFVLESFTEWRVDVTVKSLFDEYAQLEDHEIAANFDDTHYRATEFLKQLPEEFQNFVRDQCKEETNSYNDDNCMIYKWYGKTIPTGSFEAFFNSHF